MMTLATVQFVRHFLIHVFPKGLHRIRHYGLFAGRLADDVARTRNCSVAESPEADSRW